MVPDVEGCLTRSALLQPRHAVYHVVYKLRETVLLREARRKGFRTVKSIGKLVYQRAASFRTWCRDSDTSAMFPALGAYRYGRRRLDFDLDCAPRKVYVLCGSARERTNASAGGVVMRFWHTGYAEFHEPHWSLEREGPILSKKLHSPSSRAPIVNGPTLRSLNYASTDLSANRYIDRPYFSTDGNWEHIRFASHESSVRMTSARMAVSECASTAARFRSMPSHMNSIESGVCLLELAKTDIVAKFTLEFCIATEEDLAGVERQFEGNY